MGAGGIYETYTKGITVFVHRNDRAEVAHGNFYRQRKQCVHDLAGFWYVLHANEGIHDTVMREKLWQVSSVICVNRQEIAHTGLEVVMGVDNLYRLEEDT